MTQRPSFTCPDCRWRSYHPEDVKNAYCGNCHQFKVEMWMTPRCMEPLCPRFGSYYLDDCPDFHRLPPAWRNEGSENPS